MLKKKIAITLAAAMMSLTASSAFAAFGNMELIRVVSDLTSGTVEVATDLGLVSTLATKTNFTVGGGNDAFTLSTVAGHTLAVNYYAWQSSTGTKGFVDIATNNATAPNSDLSSTLKSSFNTINPYYAGLTLKSGTTGTVIADNSNLSSFMGQFGSNALGTYGGYTQSNSGNASLLFTGAPLSMTLWQFANNSALTAAVAGTRVLDLTTNADGSTTINAGTVTTTPIPAAAWLLGSGLMGLVGLRRKRNA